jgi:hypothetical protein
LKETECYAVLGIALVLAFETWEVTDTTLAVATCQRLWQHDIARVVHEPSKNIDLFGFGFLSRLTGEKAKAKEFLDQRKSRAREIMAVRRHVFDAATIPANVIPLLDDCVSRVLQDRIFKPKSWRAGEVHGYAMPELIAALLFVNVESAPAAARYVNGDWSQIDTILPIVDCIVRNVGWSSYVMGKFLDLCERAGGAYPISKVGPQANAALAVIGNTEEGWSGTILPARMAGVVQRQADWNFPLKLPDAQELLKVLDALIDLGDRRSAALEQTEAFRGIQGNPAAT